MNMLARQYRLALDFIRERVGKCWLVMTVVFLAVFVITTGITAVFVSGLDMEGLRRLVENSGNILVTTDGPLGPEVSTWYGYLVHNGGAAFWSLVLGLVPFVPLPVLPMVLNGVLWGLVLGFAGGLEGSVLQTFVWSMLPHCVFEIPANTLCDALGFVIWLTVTRKMLRRSHEPLLPFVGSCLRVYVLIVLPLLLAAGIVEAGVTPLLVTRFLTGAV